MCHAVKCHTCGKTTWSGCGRHIAQVKASVPASQWCTCPREAKPAATAELKPNFFANLFRK
ncbi:MAG: hypothetical protein PUK59_07490 [Actinomycetaceae bacterium]|nr:hypothetical protein [Actinomycetaceae bacterium]